MKRNDYINIQAPMIVDLHLKGNDLLIFALIHGYTKDGKNTCRASLSYMAEWLCTDKAAVSKIIARLVKEGFVNKLEYYEGGVKCYEYTTNYEALLAKKAENDGCDSETLPAKGVVKMTTVVKMTKKGCQNDNERVVKMTTNNNNIIYYNNFFCASPAEQEEEKKNFYKEFFFRNAADPAAEVERFIAYNNSLEWRNSEGRTYETPEKRLGLAKLWSFRQEGKWSREDYLAALEAIYREAPSGSGVEALINHKVNLIWDGSLQRWVWKATEAARRWVEDNSELVHQHLDPVTMGKKIKWQMIKAS